MHLSQDGDTRIHLSHLYEYVSAYDLHPDGVKELEERLRDALVKAAATTEVQIVHMDGEMCFHVTPSGYIILMIPWKKYTVVKDL